MSAAKLLERLNARYRGTLDGVAFSGSERADGVVILNIHFRAPAAAQFVHAGLVDESTLERLQANYQDARHAEVRDEFGDHLFLFEIEEGDGLELTRQFVKRDDEDAPYRGMHGVGAERTFHRLWRRIARPPRP